MQNHFCEIKKFRVVIKGFAAIRVYEQMLAMPVSFLQNSVLPLRTKYIIIMHSQKERAVHYFFLSLQ